MHLQNLQSSHAPKRPEAAIDFYCRKRDQIAGYICARTRVWAAWACAITVMVQPAVAFALPQGGVVAGGSATITTTADTVTIQQASDRALINWTGFDVDSGQTAQFQQPNAGSIALNRVNSNSASQINGNVNANGQVWIVNPHGTVFGQGAQVNVGGLVATTADIQDDRFMQGDHRFDIAGDTNAVIENQGHITVRENGVATLVAPKVRNSGVIEARLGKVQMASGDTMALDLYGDGLINLEASGALSQQLVENTGTIQANGGTVMMTAAAAGDVVDSLINVEGVVVADSIGEQNGEVVIFAQGSNGTDKQGNSTVLVAGNISAQGKNAGEKGGKVTITGDHVGVLAGSTIDASGKAGGGTVRVGGEYLGQGTTPHAKKVIMQSDATIKANATDSGKGGEVILWSDEATTFGGHIEARGGVNGGDGGFVETSSKEILTAVGTVDAGSAWGIAGLWLLDPNNITINTTADANVSGSPNFVTTNDSAVVTVASILASLNGGTSVTITTGTAGTNAQSGDITVAADIAKTTGGAASLTLTAHRDININTNVNITSTSNALNVTLNADSDATGGGRISMASGSSIESNGGNIVLGGGANPNTTAATGRSGAVLGVTMDNADLIAAGGNISVRGTGYAGTTNNHGVSILNGSSLTTTGTGTITVVGTSGAGTNTNEGIALNDSVISSVNGNISLTGTGVGTGSDNVGIYIDSDMTITTSGSGGISIVGTGGNGTSSNYGVLIYGNTDITTGGGAITITGDGGAGSADYNRGIGIYGGDINIGTTGTGNVTITGTAHTGTGGTLDENIGVDLNLNGGVDNVDITSVDGNISITGTGTGGGDYNQGIVLIDANIVSSGSGSVTLNGTGAAVAGATNAYGIFATAWGGEGVTISSNTGDISVTGTSSTATAASNYGFYLYTGAVAGTIESTGGGDITVTGNANGSKLGIYTSYDSADTDFIKSSGGTVTLNSDSNILLNNSKIYSPGATAFNIVINSDTDASGSGAIVLNDNQLLSSGGDITGGGGAGAASAAIGSSATYLYGVDVDSTTVTAAGGNISIRGTGFASGAANGVTIRAASTLSTTGTGTITMVGTSGASNTNADGVDISGASTVSVVNGDLTITGTGGTGAAQKEGVQIGGAGTILETTGAGNIDITATGGGSGAGFARH
jgi:filamentous hemagglutinin family protein